MKRPLLLFVVAFLCTSAIKAQPQEKLNPFAKYGFNIEISTLTNGIYEELHDLDDVVEIGSVLFDVRNRKIVGEIPRDNSPNIPVQITSLWASIDPLAAKYYHISPYAFCANNPINIIDPDGREGIVVSGSPGSHTNRDHFLVNGLDRAMKAQGRTEKGEGTTWIIYNDQSNGFNQKSLDKYTAEAQKAGINVRVVSDVDDVVSYINDKNGNNSRSTDKISNFYYVGHSTPGDLDIGYQGSGQNFDPSDLSSNAFNSGAWLNVVGGCRTAIDDTFFGITFERSVIRQFSNILDPKSTIHGSNVRVFYPGGVATDTKLLEKNNGKIITIKGIRK